MDSSSRGDAGGETGNAAALFLTGAVAVITVCLAVFDNLVPGILAGWPFLVLLAIYLAVNWRRLTRGAFIILSIAVLVTLAVFLTSDARLDPVFHRAGFFFTFLIGLAVLGRVATRSPDIEKGAAILISRPPGLRYLFLTFGTHLLGVVINFGSVIMMMSLLSSRLADLERQGIVRSLTLAVMRGFGATAFWSPLSLAPIVALSAVDNVAYWQLLPFGLLIAALYLAAGYLMDASGKSRAPVDAGLPTRDETVTLLRVGARVAGLVLGTVSLSVLFGWRMIDAVMLSVLTMGLVWLFAQKLAPAGPSHPLASDVALSARSMVNEVVIVAGASVIGSAGSLYLQDVHWFAAGLSAGAAAAICVAIPWIIVAAGMLAINPIVTCTLLVETLHGAWPSSANLFLVLAIVTGWGCAAVGTPYTANMLIGSRLVGHSSVEVALRWNGRLTLLTLLAGSLIYSGAVLLTG